jgi:hypothetical protein
MEKTSSGETTEGVMRIIGGAIVVLAGSVVFGAGNLAFALVANAALATHAKAPDEASMSAVAGMLIGVFLGLIGLVVLATGLIKRTPPHQVVADNTNG